MDHFQYKNDILHAEDVALSEIYQAYGTPCYVYSVATLTHHYQVFKEAFGTQDHLICYAVKANSNLAVLNLLAELGSGFDIVSIGELQRVIKAGGNPQKVVFSGVGKQDHEIAFALKAGIACFNVESHHELLRLQQIALHENVMAPIAFRINPDVNAKTHPYISTGLKENKFGISMDDAMEYYAMAQTLSNIQIKGIASHIGSQILELEPFIETTQKINHFISKLEARGIHLEHVDLGGGLGVRYADETPPSPKDWVEAILPHLHAPHLKIIIEPGRALVANAGILLTKVIGTKQTPDKNFAIVDAAMNDLLRPALYDSYQAIVPCERNTDSVQTWDIVGPICETGDTLGKARSLSLKEADLLALRGAGAYGFVMSSNYNSRPRAPEVMVDANRHRCVRARETFEDLIALEACMASTQSEKNTG